MVNGSFITDRTGTRVSLSLDPEVAKIEAFLLTASVEEILSDSERKRIEREQAQREAAGAGGKEKRA